MKLVLVCLVIWSATCYCEQSPYVRMLEKTSRHMSGEIDQSIHPSMFDVFSREKLFEVAENIWRSDILITKSTEPSGGGDVPSQTCLNDTRLLFEGIADRRTWALEMLDAAGKPGSALKQYEFKWWGSIDECRDSFDAPENVTQPYPAFRGQYCLAMHALIPGTLGNPLVPVLEWGICIPDTCTPVDVQHSINYILKQLNVSLWFEYVLCQPKEEEYGDDAIIVLCILAVFAALLLAATAFDVIAVQCPKWQENIITVPMPSGDTVYGSSLAGVNIDQNLISAEHTPLLNNWKRHPSQNYEPGICGKLLLSFSVYTNGAKLLSTKQSSDSLRAVHGIRFISMTWVILGHTYFFGMSAYKNTAAVLPTLIKRWTFNAIINATVSVDTFFVLSGLLVTYLTLKEMKNGGGRLNWFMYYFHRYWRLTPPYMLIIMVYVPLFKYWGDGPLWQQDIDPNCRTNIWTNLLYVNNIVREEEQCMGWAWYLANDMQFYILSPLIIVPFFCSIVFGSVMSALFLLATTISAGVISQYYELPAGFAGMAGARNPEDFSEKYYTKPWCRMGPYIVGMITGYILYKTDCKVKLNKVLNLVGWCVAAAICLAVLYGLNGTAHGHPLTVAESAFYNAMNRTAWGIGISWVVFACATGHGGFVNTLLSWKGLIPLSRLTYCAYLIHPVLMTLYTLSRHTPIDLSDLNIIYLFFGNLVAAYMIAFVASLAFESPMMGLEKVIFKRDRRN